MNEIANQSDGDMLERVLLGGDLSKLTPDQRMSYYGKVCTSVGLNPLTRPFQYIVLNGKMTLYASRDATDQLRSLHGVSIAIASREVVEGCYVVTARATNAKGRTDESIGAVPIDALKGESRSNAMMKCETKAKRRVTLSICGLGMLDESEVSSIPDAKLVTMDMPSSASQAAGEPSFEEPTLEQRKAEHDAALNKHQLAVVVIKENIAGGDLEQAAHTWWEIPEDDQKALWLAQTKGGVFSAAERQAIKSSEFRRAHFGADA